MCFFVLSVFAPSINSLPACQLARLPAGLPGTADLLAHHAADATGGIVDERAHAGEIGAALFNQDRPANAQTSLPKQLHIYLIISASA